MLEGGIPVMQTNMETENKQGKKKAKESGPFHVNQREKIVLKVKNSPGRNDSTCIAINQLTFARLDCGTKCRFP